jgi:phosphohistidine phosphatase SixA
MGSKCVSPSRKEKNKMRISERMVVFCIGLLLLAGSIQADEVESVESKLGSPGIVLMIRHAYAPGTGDPANFRIGACETQRNLNATGRTQAQQIGKWLRDRGVDSAHVYSSQWCRCIDTARLMALGPVSELPALNSFFERPQDREPNLAALRAFLSDQPADGRLVVMVTHFVTIAGITGQGVSSGEGVVLQLDGRGGTRVLGTLSFGL